MLSRVHIISDRVSESLFFTVNWIVTLKIYAIFDINCISA
uniref:Uncharacterized protein n=1 Tax=Salmonella phage PMBT37 TaxID=3153515 RepID=A0AAU8GLT6_9CAUD